MFRFQNSVCPKTHEKTVGDGLVFSSTGTIFMNFVSEPISFGNITPELCYRAVNAPILYRLNPQPAYSAHTTRA